MVIFKLLKRSFSHYVILVSFVSIALFICAENGYSAQITLTWDQNSGNGTTGYKIYYGNSSKEYSSVVDAGKQTRYTITNLIEGKTYFIVITAYNNSGKESSFSKEISYNAYTPDNKPSTAPLERDREIQNSERRKDSLVYAIKHTRLVHRPTCRKLLDEMRSNDTVSETIKTPTANKRMLNTRILELEDQIVALRVKYYDDHPKIVLLKNRINTLKKQLEAGTAKTVNGKKVKDNTKQKNILDSENVIKFSSIEQAIKGGGIACHVCRP